MVKTYIDAFTSLAALQRLPKGWDYGTDGPPSGKAVRASAAILKLLHFLDTEDYEVLPGVDSGVTIVASRGECVAEIHANADGSFNLVHERNGQEDADAEKISVDALICMLEELGWRSLRLFVSCIPSVTAGAWAGTRARHLPPQQMVGCQLSAQTALQSLGDQFAIISADSMANDLAERHRSSGEYRAIRFRELCA